MNNKFQRDAFFDKLFELAVADKDVVLVVADMSAEALDKFRIKLPSQYINVGIAEQNAIQIAAGLSLAGKKVYTYAIASFLVLRALEQTRVSVGVMNIPITILGMGTGFSYQSDGPTHHLVEDIAIMRALPHIKIMNITDSNMAAQVAEETYRTRNQTTYVRLDKDKYTSLYTPGQDLSEGMHTILSYGQDALLLTSGATTHMAVDVASNLKKQGMNITVVDIFQIPINSKKLLEVVSGAKKIFTYEEHFLPGGFGSAVCEVLSDNNVFIPTKRIGISHDKGYKNSYVYGGRNVIRKACGIDIDTVTALILNTKDN